MHTIPSIPLPVLAAFTGYAPAIRATFEVICSGSGSRLAVHTILRFTKRRIRIDQFAVAQHLGRWPDPAALRDRNEQVVTSLGLFDPRHALTVLLREAQDAWDRGVGHADIGTYRYCFVSPDADAIRTASGHNAPALPDAVVDERLPVHPQLWQAPTPSTPEAMPATVSGHWQLQHSLDTLPRRYHRVAGCVWPGSAG